MYRFEVYVRSVTVKSSNLPFWEDGDASSAKNGLSGAVAVKLSQYPLLTLLPATLTAKQVKGCKPVCLETTFSLHSGKSCTFTADRESLSDKLAQAPLCLLFLGPLAKGRPGLLGVATLQLGLENADPHPNPKFNDSCCKRVQPLSLISPAGIEIGFITAAARMFCCTPTTSRTKLILLRNESCNDSAVGNLVHSEHSKPTFDKDEQAEEFAARPLASAKAAAGDVSKVSAAVQTHTPQPDMRIEALTDTDSGRHVHQASVGLQTEEYSVPSQQAALQEPQASAALVLQSPHFHLYPPAAATAPPPPLPLQAAPQEAAQAAARQPQRCRHCEGQGHSRPGSPARQHHMRPMSRLRQSRAVSHCHQMLCMATAGLDSYCPACLLPCATPVAAPAATCHHTSHSNHLHSWDSQQQAAEQPVYVHRHSSYAEGGSGDREVIATQQQASDSQQQLVPLSVSAEAGNVSEASREQLQAWGRSGLSKATMLMRLQEALADVEQLKADLLITEDPAWQPAQSVAAPEKKRKAQRLIQHPALRHSQGQSSKLKANVALTRGHGDSAAGGALTEDKPSCMMLVHQPASKAESQAELEVDLSSRSDEHRAVPSSQNVSHKVQMRAVPSSPHISQKRQTHSRRQQGPFPGSPVAILARQQKLTANARRQSHMSQSNSSVAVPVAVQSSYTDQRWDSHQASQQLPDESSAALDTLQQNDKQSDCEGICPADKAAVTCTTAAPSDGDSATAQPADPGVDDSASADLADQAHQVAAYPVHTSAAGGDVFMSREDQKIDEADSVANQGPEAAMASENVLQTKAEAAGLPSIRAIIHNAAASVAEASQAAGTCQSASNASLASQHEQGQQGARADAELDSHKHSVQSLKDMPWELTASVPSSSSTGVAMQYPWMDPSDQQGSTDLLPQQGMGAFAEEAPGVHVTFANALPSARHQGSKIPLRYLAAAAADKAPAPSPAPNKEEAWAVLPAPEQAGVALNPEAEQGQSQHRSSAERSGTAATAGTFSSHGSTEGIKPLQWQQQPGQECSPPIDATAKQGDGSLDGNSDNGEANEGTDAVSVGSFANSAASGLGHLMRAQQPWSESESSSSPDRTSATGSADSKDISHLQAEVMSQPDTEHQLPQQLPTHMVSQLDSHQQAQQHLLLSDPEASAEAAKEELPSDEQPAQQDHGNSRPSCKHDQQAGYPPPVIDDGSRPSWALEQLAGAAQQWNYPVPVVEAARDGTLVSQQRLQATSGVSQPVLAGMQEGVNLERAASEVLEEAYSDVFEEDMPQPAADDDVSDATSVRSTSVSVHSPSETSEQCLGTDHTSLYAGAATKMQTFTSTPNIQKSTKPGGIRNDGIRL
ncbi:hypothetical protein WJX77_002481 [Trebouxia sp. C0004]